MGVNMTDSASEIYQDNLDNLGNVAIPNLFAGLGYNSIYNDLVINKYNSTSLANPNDIANFFANYYNNISPRTATAFVQSYYINILGYPNAASIPSTAYDVTHTDSPLRTLAQVFKNVIGYSSSNSLLGLMVDNNLNSMFNTVFSNFFAKNKNEGTNANTYVSDFTTDWANYLTVSAAITNGQASDVEDLFANGNYYNPGSSGTVNLQSYQEVYEAFNGELGTISTSSTNWTSAQRTFVSRFTEFYNSQVSANGYFNTSEALSSWYNYSVNLYTNPSYSPTIPTQKDGTYIINEVLMALIQMIGVVQSVAAAQANQLNFLAQWQAAYTNKLNQMHIFADGDGTVLGTTFDGKNNEWSVQSRTIARNTVNQVNQSYITKLQANQSNISDTAKAMQTNVNQSNDSANQQASIADSILQELSTILSSIFR
jgi:hypothetical protein